MIAVLFFRNNIKRAGFPGSFYIVHCCLRTLRARPIEALGRTHHVANLVIQSACGILSHALLTSQVYPGAGKCLLNRLFSLLLQLRAGLLCLLIVGDQGLNRVSTRRASRSSHSAELLRSCCLGHSYP